MVASLGRRHLQIVKLAQPVKQSEAGFVADGKHRLEAVASAVVRVGNVDVRIARRNGVTAQQTDLGARGVVRGKVAKGLLVASVHRHDVVEVGKVAGDKLSRHALKLDVVGECRGAAARIGWAADMPVAGASAVDTDLMLQAGALDVMSKDRLGSG